jgi:hypothetical protein
MAAPLNKLKIDKSTDRTDKNVQQTLATGVWIETFISIFIQSSVVLLFAEYLGVDGSIILKWIFEM